ncbi:replication protein A 70 kDa DNA-binding subunit B-like [Nicotiana sylvestris]|uniref:replication protein A 70 kDa DNA-binding subunit B-like n=1 Tax=Nicotiana sylvestris TaxID=4096 RepID=UPI00388C3436
MRIVEETNDPTFHMDIFNLRPFYQFTNQHDVDEAELFDGVAQVVTYEAVQTYKQGDNKSVFMNIELEDDKRNRISATLWSELVDQIQPHLNASTANPLIVVLQLMKAQKYQGNYSVRSCWYASKIWINPTFPQFIDFKSRLDAALQSNYESLTQTSSQQSYSIRDELAKRIVLVKTIGNLVQCTQECNYWIAAKLVNLKLQRGWSYLGCNKCTRKVEKVGNKFLCKKCNEEDCSVGHRYRLQVRVMDRTTFISLLLWNREAQQLIGKSAKELKEGLVETSDADADYSYPGELDDILDKKFMFKVIVKQTNIESQDEVYQVVKVTNDDDLLKEYAHSSFEDTITDPLEIPEGQILGEEKVYGNFVAESKIKSILQTPIKKNISESGSSVLEDGDDCNAKLSQLKKYDKRSRSANKAPTVIADDDLNSQLSSNKVRRVIKKEKNP